MIVLLQRTGGLLRLQCQRSDLLGSGADFTAQALAFAGQCACRLDGIELRQRGALRRGLFDGGLGSSAGQTGLLLGFGQPLRLLVPVQLLFQRRAALFQCLLCGQ